MNMKKIKVLFVCVHNSARSQMAEAFLNAFAPERFIAESAGIEPGELNALAVRSMLDEGIDISDNSTKSVDDMLDAGKEYDHIITVCDGANAEKCPVFPGEGKQLHWEFDDPSSLSGGEEERLRGTRIIMGQIKNRIEEWVKTLE